MSKSVEAFPNPNVLAWARRMSGLDLEVAAKKALVKPNQLRAWEVGDARPTIIQLRKLANIYKRPLALFFRSTSPPDDVSPPDFRRFDPEEGEPLSPELRLAIRAARARRQASLDLFEELEQGPPEFSASASLSDDPESLATHLRKALRVSQSYTAMDPRITFNRWCSAAESAGVFVFQADRVDLEEMRGFSISERPLPVVIVNISDAYQGRTFTLLHELVHIALGKPGLCVLEESGPSTDIQRTEAFCNHVAGASLVPMDSLLRQPETPARRAQKVSDSILQSLARRYGTSPEVVLRRLVILGRVPLSFYREHRAAYLKQYEHLRKQNKGGYASPATMALARGGIRFAQLVIHAYDEERVTASSVSELLGIRMKHLDKFREAVERRHSKEYSE